MRARQSLPTDSATGRWPFLLGNVDFFGADSLTRQVCDDDGACASATVALT